MPLLLRERLNAERQRYFIGHQHECDLFRTAIHAIEMPFSVLYFFGSGGVGKTTLLRKLVQIADAAQTAVVYLDTHTIAPSPDSFLKALQSAMCLTETTPIQVLAAQDTRYVLLIDNYELLFPLDDWLREVFLPQLSEQVLVVLAGRHPPTSAWRTDSGWQTLLHTIALQNLTLEESQLYLTKREIIDAQHQSIFNFTQGHPLALTLMADALSQRQNLGVQAEATVNMVETLLEKFLEGVPSAVHRKALDVCTVLRFTTETLLASILRMPDVHELFEWLRGLSFIEVGPSGLFPNDLLRDSLTTDLCWRNLGWYTELNQRVCTYYLAHSEQTQGHEQQQASFNYAFLHPHTSTIKSCLAQQEEHNLRIDQFSVCAHAILIQTATSEEKAVTQLTFPRLAQLPQTVLVIQKDSPSAITISPSQPTEPLLILSRPEFAGAVQEALKHFVRPDVLQNNPLLQSRSVLGHSATHDREKRVLVLQAWMQEATESLQLSPRDEKLYRALHRTYLLPALTQEQAAELLDLPFSTYRRHLKAGVIRVANILWQQEIRHCS